MRRLAGARRHRRRRHRRLLLRATGRRRAGARRADRYARAHCRADFHARAVADADRERDAVPLRRFPAAPVADSHVCRAADRNRDACSYAYRRPVPYAEPDAGAAAAVHRRVDGASARLAPATGRRRARREFRRLRVGARRPRRTRPAGSLQSRRNAEHAIGDSRVPRSGVPFGARARPRLGPAGGLVALAAASARRPRAGRPRPGARAALPRGASGGCRADADCNERAYAYGRADSDCNECACGAAPAPYSHAPALPNRDPDAAPNSDVNAYSPANPNADPYASPDAHAQADRYAQADAYAAWTAALARRIAGVERLRAWPREQGQSRSRTPFPNAWTKPGGATSRRGYAPA